MKFDLFLNLGIEITVHKHINVGDLPNPFYTGCPLMISVTRLLHFVLVGIFLQLIMIQTVHCGCLKYTCILCQAVLFLLI